MSSLKERLNRLKKSGGESPAIRPTTPISDAWGSLDAELRENDWGPYIVRKRTYPLDHKHGTYRIGDLCGEAGTLSVLCAQEQVTVAHEKLLFLDTETTGLGVGAGNVPFMIGLGYYEEDRFVIEQMFIRNPAEEAAMLSDLRQMIAERNMLVTYNGRTFDWPVVKNRFILNRQQEPPEPVHLDFLYPSRGIWRHTLPSCRLSSVERERLGLERDGDVPGSLAPTLYFQFLAEGDPAIVAGVFEHNEKDILTLACLAVHFSRLLQEKLPYEQMEAEELYRLALWLDRLGRTRASEEAFRQLLARGPSESAEYWLSAAQFYKKKGDWETAVDLWRLSIERKQNAVLAPLEPYVELAMYCEHRLKDAELALQYAEQAMERIWGRHSVFRRSGTSGRDRDYAALAKRIARLKAKLEAAARAAAKEAERSAVYKARAASAKGAGHLSSAVASVPDGAGSKRRAAKAQQSVWQQTML
jgi:uncharacterized protein YprB with RNaseH-like and TPR domain